ncbi:MAG: D-alanyl-D-alanine carboxypeptidase [Candidatus Latescibacterota bacterium]|nr:MAG: D-alanyl-D-alanine carboxypeptidase [Candidatus Latescibacterota bacterium]
MESLSLDRIDWMVVGVVSLPFHNDNPAIISQDETHHPARRVERCPRGLSLTPAMGRPYSPIDLRVKGKRSEETAMKKTTAMVSALVILLLSCAADPGAALEVVARNPYSGAIVVDAATGKVLFEDGADVKAYPASVTKLMVLLVVLEAVEAERLTLDERVTVTAEAARIGGSQVYLKENEVFPLEELLYALIVESANDAATALAIHYAGGKAVFVDMMNKRAQEIGMKDTVFRSVHGLPPGRGQLPDVSTARDIATLCRELLKKPDALKYTSTRRRPFREEADEPFIMVSHNRLLGRVDGCDGLKTGYFRAAGYSIAATAARNDRRAIAVVLGASNAKVRNAKAKEMLAKGLAELVMNGSPSARTPASLTGH